MTLKKTEQRVVPHRPLTLVFCLWALAVVSVALGLAAAVTMLIVTASSATVTATTILWSVMVFAGGCCVAAVLAALGWLCRSQYLKLLAGRRPVSAPQPLPAPAPAQADDQPRPAAPPSAGSPIEMVLEQLRELNVNVLLSEAQRKAKRQHLLEQQANQVAQATEQGAAGGDLAGAQQQLDRLVQLAPDWPRIDELRRRIEQARAEAEAKDIAQATGKIEDVMASGDFDGAEAVADALLSRHPASAPAIALLDRVRRERHTRQTERRTRLYQKLEKEVSARHWRVALSAAREFAEAFPQSAEAETVRAQMDTLTDNARIEEVRELRDRIRDLIDRRRFGEAVELAREVVVNYPDTAAAAELRQQMSRLEERARGDKASPS